MARRFKTAVLNSEPQSLLIADLTARPFTGELLNEAVIDLNETMVADLGAAEARHYRRLPYVEPTLAPVGLSAHGDNGTRISLRLSNYARFSAAAEAIAGLDFDQWLDMTSRSPLGTPISLSHSLGVNCTLETADAKLIWTRRTTQTNVGAGALNVALSEGATPFDLNSTTWHPEVTVRRGLFEELGFPNSTHLPLDVSFHSLICQLDNGGVSALAHVRTGFTSREVVAMAATAHDHTELDGDLIITPATAEAVEGLLAKNSAARWTSWSAASVLGLMALRFPGATSNHIGWADLETAQENISA